MVGCQLCGVKGRRKWTTKIKNVCMDVCYVCMDVKYGVWKAGRRGRKD